MFTLGNFSKHKRERESKFIVKLHYRIGFFATHPVSEQRLINILLAHTQQHIRRSKILLNKIGIFILRPRSASTHEQTQTR